MNQCIAFPTRSHVRPAETQISLHIRAVWSVLAVCQKTLWILCYPQTALRRHWSGCSGAPTDLCWAHMQSCRKCCVPAHMPRSVCDWALSSSREFLACRCNLWYTAVLYAGNRDLTRLRKCEDLSGLMIMLLLPVISPFFLICFISLYCTWSECESTNPNQCKYLLSLKA